GGRGAHREDPWRHPELPHGPGGRRPRGRRSGRAAPSAHALHPAAGQSAARARLPPRRKRAAAARADPRRGRDPGRPPDGLGRGRRNPFRSLRRSFMALSVDVFWSFRSPYSYLATPRLLRLAAEFEVDITVRVVLPIAVRIPGFFDTVNPHWAPYLLRDT